MPPVSQQSSRAGLITTVVIFAILTITFISTTLYYNSQKTLDEKKLVDMQKNYDAVVLPGQTTGDIVQNARLAAPNAPAIDTLAAQISELTAMIKGTPDTFENTKNAYKAAVNNTALDLSAAPYNVSLPTDAGLTGVISTLAKAVEDRQHELGVAIKARDDAANQVTGSEAMHKAELDKREKDVADKETQLEAAKAAFTKSLADKDTAVAAAAQTSTKKIEENGAALQANVAEMNTLKGQLATVSRERDALKQRLAQRRPNVEDPTIRQPDGVIVRLPSPGIVFIDLGQIDHVTPGLTFEVYDRSLGVPGLGDGTSSENLPAGKASIEIIRVGQNSSECRVVSVKTGEQISEGDYIANLVYDRHMKYTFFVYGDFDPDQSGAWTAQKAEIIKDLAKRWGGSIADHVGPNVDFVVVGREPELPNFSKEELEGNALDKAQYDKAVAALNAYNQIISQAKDLHIPVMNQARFLYYTGYFELAKR